MPYYSEVEKWSNIYAYHIGVGGSYSHSFKTVKLYEFYCYDICTVGDGAMGGTTGAFCCHWQMGADYNDDIVQGMNY